MEFRLFSVDDHIIEPPHVWLDRLPSKYQEHAPRVVDLENGRQSWVMEDRVVGHIAVNPHAGRSDDQWMENGYNFDNLHPATYDAKERSRALREDGVVASVGFPDAAGFAGYAFTQFKDKELADLCVKAWNDWMLDEWCATDPELFVPNMVIHLWDPKLAAAEIQRCAAKGARSLCFPEAPHLGGLPGWNNTYWDPVWNAAQEAELVINVHGGSSGGMPMPSPDASMVAMIVGAPTFVGGGLISVLVTGRTLREFPELKFVSSEGGIGYLPYMLERMKFIEETHEGNLGLLNDTPMTEIFRNNIWVCAVHEKFGLQHRDIIGVDKILWESDFPHSESFWPNSQSATQEYFEGMPEEDVNLITHKNAQSLFRFGGVGHN